MAAAEYERVDLKDIAGQGVLDSRTVQHHCSVSMGVVVFINANASRADIRKWADAAMYRAKDAGRNTIRFHEPRDQA